jgi:hypothetical protein
MGINVAITKAVIISKKTISTTHYDGVKRIEKCGIFQTYGVA